MHLFNRRFALLFSLLAATPLHAVENPTDDHGAITVFAAASMTNVLEELAAAYTKQTGTAVTLSFGASSTLARQIEAGARVDAFVSADREWMDYLAERKLIEPSSRRDIAGNALVLIAPADRAVILIAPGFALRAALGDGRLAVADPDIVPAGRYAKAALTQLGAWDSVADRLASADNVRAALAFVARGEAPLGIVYATDALIDKKVKVVGLFPASSHAPIAYPAAVPTGGRPAGAAFLAFLGTPAAEAAFARHGFTKPKAEPQAFRQNTRP